MLKEAGERSSAGFYICGGYRVLTGQVGHPLASSARRGSEVKEHRKVLYDAIGSGDHPCHWCGVTLSWGPNLTVDHLDNDRLNNVIENLVPSCLSCNVKRAQARLKELAGGYCSNGHDLSVEGVDDGRGFTACRGCGREAARRYRKRKKHGVKEAEREDAADRGEGHPPPGRSAGPAVPGHPRGSAGPPGGLSGDRK